MKDGFMFLALVTGLATIWVGTYLAVYQIENKKWLLVPALLFLACLITGFVGSVL